MYIFLAPLELNGGFFAPHILRVQFTGFPHDAGGALPANDCTKIGWFLFAIAHNKYINSMRSVNTYSSWNYRSWRHPWIKSRKGKKSAIVLEVFAGFFSCATILLRIDDIEIMHLPKDTRDDLHTQVVSHAPGESVTTTCTLQTSLSVFDPDMDRPCLYLHHRQSPLHSPAAIIYLNSWIGSVQPARDKTWESFCRSDSSAHAAHASSHEEAAHTAYFAFVQSHSCCAQRTSVSIQASVY